MQQYTGRTRDDQYHSQVSNVVSHAFAAITQTRKKHNGTLVDTTPTTNTGHTQKIGATVTGDSFLDMLESWLLPQLNTNYDDYILQLDGAPPHFHRNVRVLLNRVPPQRWIGRAAANGDKNLLPWPPRSPDLTPLQPAFMYHHCPRPSMKFVIG
jgi:hypothetical protein